MLEAKLTIECPALEALAAAIARYNLPAPAPAAPTYAPPMPVQPVNPTPAPAATPVNGMPQGAPSQMGTPAPVQTHMPPVGQMAPAPAQAPVAASVPPFAQMPPMTPSAPVPTAYPSNPAAVPTSPAPGFTVEQVGKAGAEMISANPAKMPELLGLLQQFGVQAIQELRPEQLGPFATALRGLGAKI